MLKIITTAAIVCAAAAANAQESLPTVNTIKVDPTDTEATIVEKAIRVVPTRQQMNALENEFIAFIHFGPNTFTRREWGTGFEDPAVFAPESIDTDQWVKAMKDAGMKMVVVTAKHHDGFVIWQSRYTDHGIMSSPYMGGKGDVIRDLSKSCAKYGMKMGVYLSPADLYQIENPEGLYGNLSKKTMRKIPRDVEGRPFENKTTFEFELDDYNEYFMNQLFELLTEYGPIHEVWFDGAHPKSKGGQTYNYPAWRELIRTLAPEAVIFGREDVRWCGNEAGDTRDTEWNVVGYDGNPDTMTVFRDMTDYDLGSRAKLASSKYLHYQQPEVDTSIRAGWFYRDDDKQSVRSADDVFDIYERSVGGNSTLILNIPPNREGRFSERELAVLSDVGKRIRETYGEGTDLLQGSDADKALTDGDNGTWVDASSAIEIKLKNRAPINRIVLQEPIATSSERIEKVAVDALTDGVWSAIDTVTNVGYKRIIRFPDVEADGIRIRVLESRATPYLSSVSAHHYKSRPPQLTISNDAANTVTVSAKMHDFAWKRGEANPAETLSMGYTIHYTTDGSTPTAESTKYEGPFTAVPGVVKAIAVVGNESGAVAENIIGYAKTGWKVTAEPSGTEKHEADKAIDGDTGSYWYSGDGKDARITIDMGRKELIKGIAYTPQTETGGGMLAAGEIQTSNDGKKWKSVGKFEFGNLVNDPTRRYHYLSKPVKSRYVRIVTLETAGKGEGTAIAELDIL